MKFSQTNSKYYTNALHLSIDPCERDPCEQSKRCISKEEENSYECSCLTPSCGNGMHIVTI